jgi:hypothetical protein
VQKEEHQKYLKSHNVTQQEHQPKKQKITDAIPYKERDVSNSRGNYKQKAPVLISAIRKNLTFLKR